MYAETDRITKLKYFFLKNIEQFDWNISGIWLACNEVVWGSCSILILWCPTSKRCQNEMVQLDIGEK